MDQHLHGLFARALDDEPQPPADLTRAAMEHGTTLRRRRHLRIGGIAGGSLVAAALALNLAVPAGDSAPSPETAALPVPAASRCVPQADVAIFLKPDVTATQRAGLRTRLTADPRIRAFTYESREDAYRKFADLWRDNPDLIEPVDAAQMPEAFRVTLTTRSEYRAFVAGFAGQPGVDEVTRDGCLSRATGDTPAGSSTGEAR